MPTRQDDVENRDKVYYNKLSHTLPHVIAGGVLQISSDEDTEGFFGGLKFLMGNLASIFLGGLVYMQVGTFLGI